MPSGNGQLLLSVKAEIRKKIKKQAGDYVHVILYPDNEPLEIPEELLLCLQEDQDAQQFFHSLNENAPLVSERKNVLLIVFVFYVKKNGQNF